MIITAAISMVAYFLTFKKQVNNGRENMSKMSKVQRESNVQQINRQGGPDGRVLQSMRKRGTQETQR